MRNTLLLILFLFPWLACAWPWEPDSHPQVKVADPYIELHTGPGEGYPIFYVVERGDSVEVLKSKTNWYKVRTAKGKEGWVSHRQMANTLMPSGDKLALADPSIQDFDQRRWEMGVLTGDFGGGRVISLYGGYSFNPYLGTELTVTQVLGEFYSSFLLDADLVAQPFPEWRISPFFALGGGAIRTQPHATLVQTRDRNDVSAHAGIGVRAYLTRRFFFRAEYKRYTIFTSHDSNEEINEWKAGFGFFF